MTSEFIKRYRDSDDAWESDGYKQCFPEEVEEDEDEDKDEEKTKAEIVEEHTAKIADEEKCVDAAECASEGTPEKVERKEDTDGRIFYQKL